MDFACYNNNNITPLIVTININLGGYTMQCDLVLNLANSMWFENHENKDVLSDCKWINSNLNTSNALLVNGPSEMFVTDIKTVRSITIGVLNGDSIDNHLDFLCNCLKESSFYNTISVKNANPTIELVSTSSNENRIISDIIIELIESINTDLISRIRRCGVDDCQFYFLDKSKNQNKKYCSTKCNNVAKVRRFREKK